MISAAYAVLGLRIEGGLLVLPADPTGPKGALQLRRLTFRGQDLLPPAPTATTRITETADFGR
jgi:hypothetical protein